MIEFLRDYRGKATGERFFTKGTQTDEFSTDAVKYLVEVGAAKKVDLKAKAKAEAEAKAKAEAEAKAKGKE